MFDQLTDYQGIADDLHIFKFKSFDESIDNEIKFYFLFDKDLSFVRAKISQKDYGEFPFEVVEPLITRDF